MVANLVEKFAEIDQHWTPGAVPRINDYEMRIAKIKGEFVWHKHDDTDELFLIHKGRMRMELRDGLIEMGPGDVFVVPRGTEHRPVADDECEIIMIEPTGTANTGNVGGKRNVEVVDI